MGQLKQMLQDYCPDGVPFLKLGDIATDIYRGSGITRSEVRATGTPCVRYGEIYTTYGSWFDRCVSHVDVNELRHPKFFGPGDILFAITGENVDDIAKSTAYVGSQQCLAGGDIVVLKHRQNPKFLSYALETADARRQKSKGKVKSKVVHSSVPAIKEIVLPIPPLCVQEEIVRILEDFTLLSSLIEEEIELRNKQYEHHRDTLLAFNSTPDEGVPRTANLSEALASQITGTDDPYECSQDSLLIDDALDPESGFEFKRLGEVCDLKAGKTIPSAQISSQRDAKRSVPCFGGNGLRGYVENANQHGDRSLIGRQGALCGNVCYATGDFYATEHAIVVTDMGHYDSRFLYHMLAYLNLNRYKTAGAQPGLSVSRLSKIMVPVPPLHVQEKAVEVLDRFTELTTSLRAELKARQKQYAYYRDKLLTFKELEA